MFKKLIVLLAVVSATQAYAGAGDSFQSSSRASGDASTASFAAVGDFSADISAAFGDSADASAAFFSDSFQVVGDSFTQTWNASKAFALDSYQESADSVTAVYKESTEASQAASQASQEASQFSVRVSKDTWDSLAASGRDSVRFVSRTLKGAGNWSHAHPVDASLVFSQGASAASAELSEFNFDAFARASLAIAPDSYQALVSGDLEYTNNQQQ